ncbi:hypothetical protein TIFTF001_044564 [Ficus carica]|uniref:ABC transporter domain-containing protein n=1 Tax=Ficus carica TaxID=3494 RepID=A0AA87ZAB1_FICCA|nr:hypothetical protein TIFTF001_044564 [Ficus carica]
MKEQGCEIEAIAINYNIQTQNRENPFKIFTKKPLLQSHHQVVEPEEPTKVHKGSRQVLSDVNCRAKPWEILAIVGPSGAGKSSLLEILAGKATPQSGSVLINGKSMDKAQFRKTSGFVTQKDMLFPLLTVEETLMFSAKLRLRLPQPQLTSKVKSLLQELGLSHVAGARVGDDRVRGISGGERRRVSIGVDVIHDPKVLILDEPTSGLDSTSALQIVDMLKTMAETRGRTANQIPQRKGIISSSHRNDNHQEDSKSGKFTLQQLFQQSKVIDEEIILANSKMDFSRDDFVNSRLKETVVLTHRFSKNIFRTKELFACRTIQMLLSGLVLGSIFCRLKDDLVGAQERVGLFAFILTFLLSSTIEALPIFLQEREILMKETSSGSYRVSSYAIANGLVYLPFLLILAVLFSLPLYWLVGLNQNFMAFVHFLLLIWLILYTANSVVVCFSALVPNFIVGNSVISGVMGSFFLFSGYFISKEEIPKYWIFMHFMSLFKYPFEGFLINEFSNSGKCLEYLFDECMVSGEDVLREEGYGEESRWRNVGVMVGFILVYRFISYVILRCRCSQRGLKSVLV